MSSFSHYHLQTAIYQALTGDAALMSLVTAVYDRPPQGTGFAYITIGESAGSDWSSKTTGGMEHIIAVHVWSREGGRRQAAVIMERVHTLLHRADVAVSGQTLVMMRFVASEIVLENDGWTYHGVMQFRVLLEAN